VSIYVRVADSYTEESDMFDWLMARLRERSTWLGIVSFLTAAGVVLEPEVAEGIVAAGLAIAGIVAAIGKDR